jgi:hypothetical protein
VPVVPSIRSGTTGTPWRQCQQEFPLPGGTPVALAAGHSTQIRVSLPGGNPVERLHLHSTSTGRRRFNRQLRTVTVNLRKKTYPVRCSEPPNTVNRPAIRHFESGWRDSNPRPLRPERSALPSCATPRLKPRQRIAPPRRSAKADGWGAHTNALSVPSRSHLLWRRICATFGVE